MLSLSYTIEFKFNQSVNHLIIWSTHGVNDKQNISILMNLYETRNVLKKGYILSITKCSDKLATKKNNKKKRGKKKIERKK